ncbi:hypothetical protein [Mesorhizobium sp. YM1C-6-2]|uniref:hypothetical protein n=1 Tax=Mesorhizobium sp. YM1C-6-2 TaxID=1827501 RepID=UPI000EF1E012|nr:hypothetical protein [Mesorhizobium sp. YM1C-6-2]RLP28387.1 hypothetical protein D8676_04415 [Mesorhizobium sp. YM1C-6-2]
MLAGSHAPRYDDQQLDRIALAIGDGSDLEKLKPFRERFRDAASWYFASLDRSRLIPDKEQKSAIEALASACARFRKHASIKIGSGIDQRPAAHNLSGKLSTAVKAILRRLGADKGSWDDRLPDRKLALLLSDEAAKYELEDSALRRHAAAIEGYQADLGAAVAAVDDLAERARRGQNRLERVRKLTVREGNSGDVALNTWIATHMTIYEEITGRYAGRSTTGTPREPGGPLNRFVMASAEIVGIKASARSIDQRILRLLRFRRNAQKKI